MSILENAVTPNDYGFVEKKLFGDPVSMKITNSSTRTIKFAETVFFDGFIGDVMETDGIAASESGYINISPNRHISMNQVDVADTFAAGKNPIFFVPQTNSVVGYWTDTTATDSVLFKAVVIGSAPAATPAYIEFKPPYQNGDLELIT